MCSRIRGPANDPSFVTCPTKTSVMSAVLAKRVNRAEHSRTCVTLPGALSKAAEKSV